MAAFFLLDLGDYLTWDALVERRQALRDAVDGHLVVAMLAFVAVYVVVTGLSLPGAAVLSLAGGVLFGRWLGTGLVSVASTAGATAAFLSARYLLRDFVERRWGPRVAALNRGLEADGIYYLLFLRLVPLFPFFLINAGMGLTRMRVRTFWWVSQLGMLPGTFLYVNAGTELASIDSPRDVLSPGLLIALALLGIVPLVVRKLLTRWRRSRAT